jgi:hypothetical protein
MGEIKNNNVMGTAAGKAGLVVFKQVPGKIIAANLPTKGRKGVASEKPQGVMSRFKNTTP